MWPLIICIYSLAMFWRYRQVLNETPNLETRQTYSGKSFLWKKLYLEGRPPMPCVCLGISKESGQFSFIRENPSHRWAKWLGMCREFQTGDATFDKSIYIVSDNYLLLKILRQSSDVRQLIQEIFKKGAHHVKSDGKEVWITLNPHYANALHDSEIAEFIALLDRLAEALKEAGKSVSAQSFSKAIIIFSVNAVLLIAGLAEVVFGLRFGAAMVHWGLSWYVLPYALAACFMWLYILSLIFSKSALGYTVAIDTMITGFLGFWLWFYVGAYYINIHYDDSPSVEHKTYVFSTPKHVSSRYKRRHYGYYKWEILDRLFANVKVQHWENPKETWKLANSYELGRYVERGMPLSVYTRKGYLGFEWVEKEIYFSDIPPK